MKKTTLLNVGCISSIFFIFTIVLCQGSCCIEHPDFLNRQSSTILLTGFGPFDIHDINPSEYIVRSLDGQEIEGYTIVSLILPVDFNHSLQMIVDAIEEYHPSIVVNFGLSASASTIEVEYWALNLRTNSQKTFPFSFPSRINKQAPFLQRATLPVTSIVTTLQEHHIPVRLSYFAGLYVCNAVMFKTLHYLQEHQLPIKAGFVHVPLLSFQHPAGMELETMLTASYLIVKTSLP